MPKKKLNKGSSGQNRKASEDYIDKYRQKEGVQQTASGLLYKQIETGNGLTPTEADSVQVNQRIQLVGGKIIGDTYKEGLQLMQEGDRFEFVVPPELAWGKKGAGNKIGPNAVLIFDVRLTKVLMR